MATKVIMPKPGMGSTEGTIAKWLKAEGDKIIAGEILAEIEMAKAVEELPSPVSGVLTKILVAEGQTVEVYAPIAVIEE
jgi:pyruvate dehydrogenase E2 component (dihydrolipoamide acetyltransferase)